MNNDLNEVLKYFKNNYNDLISINEEIDKKIKKKKILISQIENKISELENEIDKSENLFSPVHEEDSFMYNEIKNLKSELIINKQELEKDLSTKKKTSIKIKKINKMIEITNTSIDTIKLMETELENINCEKNINENESCKIMDDDTKNNIVSKIEFCKKIVLSDGRRCKSELDSLIKIIESLN